MTTKQDVARFGGKLGDLAAKLKAVREEREAIDQALGLIRNAPHGTETNYGMGDAMQIPSGVGMPALVPPTPQVTQRDTGIDYGRFAQSPEVAMAMTDKNIAPILMRILSANQVKLQGASPFENQYDQYGGLRQGAMEKPVAETKQDLGQPTYLAKAQRELEALRQANPNDPRIPQYEKYIQRIVEGIPTYQAIDVEGEGITPWNPRKGEFVGQPTGKFKPAPASTKTTYTWIQDNLDTMDKLKSMSDLYDANTGLFTGSIKNIIAKGVDSPEYQTLRSTLQQMRTIVYGFSGKQINEQEQQWLNNEILPEMSNPTDNFVAKMNVLDAWLQDKEASLKRNFPSLGQLPARPRKQVQRSGDVQFDPQDFEAWLNNRK